MSTGYDEEGVRSDPGPMAAPPASVRTVRPSGGGGSSSRPFLLGCLIGVMATAVGVMLLFVGVPLLFIAALSSGAGYEAKLGEGVQVREVPIAGEKGAPKIAIVPVEGLLIPGGEPLVGRDPVPLLRAMLDRARDDADVRAVILAVDSPGGAITTCDILHKAIEDYRRRTGKPVVALMGDVAASGGYYVACAADYIIAHPTTITGSIGVMMPVFDASGLMKKLGVTDRTVKSGPLKNMGSMFAERTPEQWQKESEVLEGVVRQMHERFVHVVAEGRRLKPEQVRTLADGRIYTSEEALDSGLIDAVGYREDAIEKAEELARVARARVVRYSRVPSLRDVLLAGTGGRRPRMGLLDELPARLLSQPLYLWAPSGPGPVE